MILTHINDIASVCAGHGITTAVISPGSRSAAITLAFTRHSAIETFVIPDERSAAFVAAGMAQQKGKPVVLICTSGSAAYNYAPAIAEAYFQEIPLIVLTADRPPEWTNQYDGQTIMQSGIYGKHVKSSFDFPVEVELPDVKWHCNRIVNESIINAMAAPQGPAHINISLREPFYPAIEEDIQFDDVRVIKAAETSRGLDSEQWNELQSEWKKFDKRAIVVGQYTFSEALSHSLSRFSEKTGTPVISDIISNQQGFPNRIKHQDTFLNPKVKRDMSSLVPDLLITVGNSLISKNLKIFLRNNPPKAHWHINLGDRLNDSLQHVSRILDMKPEVFFEEFKPSGSAGDLNTLWHNIDRSTKEIISNSIEASGFGEFKAVACCMKALPNQSQLHLANSMAVRYANIIGLPEGKGIPVYTNRGTSGIDGSNSTAVGAVLSQDQVVTLITGDMAFFYDRNAFWHNYNLKNLRVVILNNHAGGIFRMIEGPSNQPELEAYFETEQRLNARLTAEEFGFEYTNASNESSLNVALNSFYEPSDNAKILEIESSSVLNAEIFASFKQKIIDQI